jgi:hypothetical protein
MYIATIVVEMSRTFQDHNASNKLQEFHSTRLVVKARAIMKVNTGII